MRKALLVLFTSLLVLMGLLAYDIIKCDGNVLLNPLLGVKNHSYDTYTEPEKTDNNRIEDMKLTFTSPDIVKPAPVEESDKSVDESGMPEAVEVDSIADEDRGYEFYFPQLSDVEKNVYREMYNAFASIESGNIIPSCESEEMNRVVTALKDDHPEFFYLGDLGYTHYTVGGLVQRTTLSVEYKDPEAIIDTQQRMIDGEVARIINSIPAGADEYTKIKYVYEAIIDMTDYDLKAPNNQTIVSVLLNKKSVCAGYARAMQYILNKLDIPTTFVEGYSLISGEEHAWNLCKLEDGYYFIDATWGDASYTTNSKDVQKIGDINYDYLLVTSEELLRTHSIDTFAQIPVCDSTANNYYVREGLYLTEYNYDYIKSIFDNGYAQGKSTVSFKCANGDVYEEVLGQLIKKSGVFELLDDSSKTVSYANDPEQRTICFWL